MTLKPEFGEHNHAGVIEQLEKGQIKEEKELASGDQITLLVIQGGLTAFFKEDDASGPAHSDFELLAFDLDQVLRFHLLPHTARRQIDGRAGSTYEVFRQNDLLIPLDAKWDSFVDDQELAKAAVFDFLINAGDRNWRNFFVDTQYRTIKLFGHDEIMFLKNFSVSDIVRKARERNLSLSQDILDGIQHVVPWTERMAGKFMYQEILTGIKSRAQTLLTEKRIPA